jgi:ABC-type hemin transport system ATPase subunit
METSASDLAADVRRQRQILDRLAGKAEQVAVLGKAAEAEVAGLRDEIEIHDQVCALLTSIAEEAQETARAQVEGLVTRALQVVFGPEMSFHLRAAEAGGQAVLDMVIRTDYQGAVTEAPVLRAHGGGVSAVVGYVLQLVVLLLTPSARRILLLDEPFAMVDSGRAVAVAEFLREVSDMAGVQQVLVTHDPVYAQFADCRVRLEKRGGVTRVLPDECE